MEIRPPINLHFSPVGPAESQSYGFRNTAPEGHLGVQQLAAAFAGYTHAIKGASKLVHSRGQLKGASAGG